MYYCPKCDRTVSKERLEQIDLELRSKFGKSGVETLKCPVCDTAFIDLDSVAPGGEKHVGRTKA